MNPKNLQIPIHNIMRPTLTQKIQDYVANDPKLDLTKTPLEEAQKVYVAKINFLPGEIVKEIVRITYENVNK